MSSIIRPKGNKFCLKHPNRELIFTCDNCEETLICDICVSSEHKGHTFAAIAMGVQGQFNIIQDFNTFTEEKTIPKLEETEKAAEISFDEFEQHIRSDITNIEASTILIIVLAFVMRGGRQAQFYCVGVCIFSIQVVVSITILLFYWWIVRLKKLGRPSPGVFNLE